MVRSLNTAAAAHTNVVRGREEQAANRRRQNSRAFGEGERHKEGVWLV